MSAIPASAMPHAYAEDGVDLRDPHPDAARADAPSPPRRFPAALLLGGAAALALVLYRALR